MVATKRALAARGYDFETVLSAIASFTTAFTSSRLDTETRVIDTASILAFQSHFNGITDAGARPRIIVDLITYVYF